MAGRRLSILCAVAIAAAVPCHAAPAVDASFPGELIPGVMGPPQGTYAAGQTLVPASLATGSIASYRFSGQEPWMAFDRPLYLAAFSGEERRYTIEFRSSDGSGSSVLVYTIDARPPEPPRFSVAQGDVGPAMSLAVAGSGDIFISVDGAPFEPAPPDGALEFVAPEDGTRVVVVSAYVVDQAGNASRAATARWRLHPEGFAPSYPLEPYPVAMSVYRDASIAAPAAELTDRIGFARLTVGAPDGAAPCVAVNADDPFGSAASYVELSGASSAASCDIPFPWGYGEPIVVHYGYVRDGIAHVAPEPVRLTPRFPSEGAPDTPATPVAPAVALDGQAARIDWPASPWTIMYSAGDTAFAAYRAPFSLELGETATGLRYYALGPDGSRSATGVVELPARRAVVVPKVAGVEHGSSYGSPVAVVPLGEGRIRYSQAEGDDRPPALSEQSPFLGSEGLRFEGRPGETIRYRLRLVAEPSIPGEERDAALYQERFVSFVVDRQPPPVPEAAQGVRGYSSSDSFVSFKPQPGVILVSVSENGDGPFARYEAPVAINGSDDGRRRFVIRAYAEDEFGNRSAEMRPMSVLIDRSSLYADSRGRPGASGSPDDPIPFLDDAMEAAQAAGKRFVYARGSVSLRRTVVISSRLTVAGGFDEEWNESGGARAEIAARVAPSSAAYAFVVDGGALVLSSVDISMRGEGAGGVVLARSGSVLVRGSTLGLSGGVEMAALRSTGASVSLESSSVGLSSTVTGRGVDASGAALSIRDSTIACDSSVRLFDAVRINDGDAVISGLRIEASPSHALSAISATAATASVDRSVVSIRGGASSCRVFGAAASRLSVSSAYVDVSWKGAVEVLSASGGSIARVAHVTAIVGAPQAVFAASSASSLEIKNSIASFHGGDSTFLRGDSVPVAGSVAANCLWGFTRSLDGSAFGAVADIAALNRYAGGERPNITEEPAKTFYASIKGLMRLSASSACVDSGVALDWAAPVDLLGRTRGDAAGNPPDIGAEEL